MTRVQETALGNLFTDGAAWYVRNKLGRNDVDFVFLDGGYIDNALSKGTITVGAISGITQPDSRKDKMMFLTLTGAELKLFFNDVADVVHTGRGGPHETMYWGIVSEEVNYTIQYPKPPAGTSPELSSADSERYYHGIIKAGTLKIKNKNTGVYEAVVDGNTYRICTTDFLVSGEYFLNLATLGVKEPVTDVLFWHAVAEYIYDKGTVTPSLDARIRVEGGMVLPPPWIPGTGE
jgi:2',3'-cyclic-nucleotide 2'-phosphodiesterase (5'-nucleotidase family)